jgi:nucleotide-binding universal stress UspA family protein
MFTRILVPTDFSAPSDAALAHARKLAWTCNAALHLLHVLEDIVDTASFGSEVFVPDSPDVRAGRIEAAHTRLAHRVGTGDDERPRATTDVIVGSSARAIARYAADNGFDLIVMGTHGRTGFAHLVLGSVAEHVVRTAPCPVLTVHEPRVETGASVPPMHPIPVGERA